MLMVINDKNEGYDDGDDALNGKIYILLWKTRDYLYSSCLLID